MAAEPERGGAALILAPEVPYPLAGGGALRTASLLHYLARTRVVDLIVFRQPGAAHPAEALPAGLVRHLSVIDLPRNAHGLAARLLRNAARVARETPPLVDRFAGFEDQVEAAIAGRRYDVGLVEHSWCAPYWPQLAPACGRMILDLHNIESVLHERCGATENRALGFAHRVFHGAALELEREWLPRYSLVLATSEGDACLARAIAPGAKILVYPNAVPLATTQAGKPVPRRDHAIVFSGNLEYHPNISAVRFFRAEIWPLLRERWPRLVWRLAGKNPEAVRRYTSGDPRIEVRGPMEDAVAELARSQVAVVPLLAASGTRLKILEAWAAGLPVVSTTIGAEGLGARPEREILLADDPAAFSQAVSRLLACPDLRETVASAARSLLEKEFTWETAWQRLDF